MTTHAKSVLVLNGPKPTLLGSRNQRSLAARLWPTLRTFAAMLAGCTASASINPSLVGGIATLLKQLDQTSRGSFVVIEHNMDFVMDLCHRVMVMVEGTVMAIGTPAEIRANKQVLDACLGN